MPRPLSRALLVVAAAVGLACAPAKPGAPLPSAPESAAATTSPADASAGDDSLEVAGTRFVVEINGRTGRATRAELRAWVERSAAMVADYYGGRFPVPSMRIVINLRTGDSVGFGQQFDGRLIRVSVGRDVSERSLTRDWVMPHEMLHTGFPDLRSRHRWMQEGLSTYLETIVRVRAGVKTERELWSRWLAKMPLGRPGPGDRGLDITRTWGRLYWGGALFWLALDLRLRRATNNAESVQTLVQGLVAAGGDGRADWTTARVRELGDQITGTSELSELYAEMAEAPGDVETDRLWAELGVRQTSAGTIVFDDSAPQAALRRALTQ